jgi:hypothetical protein
MQMMQPSLRILRLICCLAVVSLAVTGNAQDADAPRLLLEHLTGDWVLTGVLGKKPAVHDVHAEWVLNHEYIRLHESSREKKQNGEPAYEAIIFISWDPKAQQFACLWLDNTEGGGLSAEGIAYAKPKEFSIPFEWVQSGAVTLRNTFSYNAKLDTWRWAIDNVTKGKAAPFGDVTLTRATPSLSLK